MVAMVVVFILYLCISGIDLAPSNHVKSIYRRRSFGNYFLSESAPLAIGGYLEFCILNSLVHSRCKKHKTLTKCCESMHKVFFT